MKSSVWAGIARSVFAILPVMGIRIAYLSNSHRHRGRCHRHRATREDGASETMNCERSCVWTREECVI